jgi:alpha-L-fucosidase 2
MRITYCIALHCILILGSCFSAAASAPEKDLVLWFNQPARQWDHGLPVGNGRLGGVLLGGVQQDRLYLNEESIWSHDGSYLDRPNAHKHIPEVRRLLFEGKYEEAEKLMMDKVMQERLPSGTNANQELGYLDFAWEGQEQVRHYRRTLDIEEAVATVRYDAGEAAFTRTLIASAPDQVVVYRIESSLDSMLQGAITFGRAAMPEAVDVEGNTMKIAGLAGKKHGARYHAMITIETEGGSVQPFGNGWKVRGCKTVTVYVSARTDYNQSDPALAAENDMMAATTRAYNDILADHVREYQGWFNRCALDLGQTDARHFPTDQRIEATRSGSADPGLMALYVQFGRYLLISSSRPGDMPANLQGIWVQGIAPPWNSDYHININIQMNYWPGEVTNLSECHMPFLDFIDQLRENGRATASELYNCDGFTAHHTTDAWHYTTSFGFPVYGAWPMGAGWASSHMWEHFRFTGDTLFLQRKGYPVMKEAAAFFMDFMVKDPETGMLVSGPSMSPENRFVTPSGGKAAMCMGPAMDHQIIYDNLTACISAGELLDVDKNLRKKWQKALDQLTPPKIGPDGRIMEWSKDFVEAEPGHRHMSHLYGLHPGSQFTWQHTPEFMEAARKVIEARLSHGGGHTGWSRAWMINFYARLKDGEAAYRNMQALLQKSTLPNMWDTHPPFQIDGNFGATAGIVEMLLQSHAGEIELLPALPEAWPAGSIAGARARGAFEVDVAWSDGVLTKAVVKSLKGGVCRLSYRGHILESTMVPGGELVVGAADFD